MGNSLEEKSPTVRSQIFSPRVLATRISEAMRRISEPIRSRAILHRPARGSPGRSSSSFSVAPSMETSGVPYHGFRPPALRRARTHGMRHTIKMPSVPRRSLKALVWVFRPGKGGPEVLLLQRPARRGGGLHPVTGKAEDGEKPLAAAAREALEETGLEGAISDLGFVHEFTTPKGRLAEEHAFLLVAAPRAQVRISDEHDGFAWLEPASAREAVSWQAHRESLELALVEFSKDQQR